MISARLPVVCAFLVAAYVLTAPTTTFGQQSARRASSPDKPASAGSQGDAAAAAGRVGEDARQRVAVVALGGSPSEPVTQALFELLDDDGFEVVDRGRLRRMIAPSLVPRTAPEVSEKFVGLATRIGRGIEKFFYKGNDAALEILRPVFNFGMAHPEVLTRRPDYARQIFEAGLVMVRAYRKLDRSEEARRLARALVEAFPGFDLRTNSVPPAVLSLLAEQRKALGEDGSSMTIDMVRGDGCKAVVNGTMVGDKPFAVAPGHDYFATMDCGEAAGLVWRATAPAAGRAVQVPIAAGHPLDYSMADAGSDHRNEAESYLKLIAFWTDVPRVVGAVWTRAPDAGHSAAVVHLGADGRASWCDRTDDKPLRRMLAGVMDDYGGPAAASSPAVGRPTDWMSWSLIGAGGVIAGASIWGLVAADGRRDELRCSPTNTSPADPASCTGVATVVFANDDAFGAARSKAQTVTILSGAGLAVGLGLAGWGLYRITRDEAPTRQSVRWEVGVSGRAANVSAIVAF